MGISVKARHLPPRIAAGAFILNSGIGKLSADEATAAQIHGFAAGTYPFLNKLKPKDFVRLQAAAEITLGTALLIPVIRHPSPGPAWRCSRPACLACMPGRPACASKAPRYRPSRGLSWPRTSGWPASAWA